MAVQKTKQLTNIYLIVIFVAAFLLQSIVIMSRQVQAAQFTNAFVRLDRMKASTATGGTVCAKPATTGTEADVQVTFPTGFTVNSTASNWTVTTTNLPTGSTAWVSINTASSVSGQTVTFPSGDLTVGTLYCFNFTGTNTLTNSTAGSDKTGTITTRTSGAATIDSSSYATAVISDDQISVTATVPATFSLSIGTCSSNTDVLGSLSTGSVTSSSNGCRITLTTNASNGWYVWAKDSQQGLRSTAMSYTIATTGTLDGDCESLTAGTEGYGLDVNLITDASGGGTVDIHNDFECTSNDVGPYAATFSEVASSNGPANGDIIEFVHKAAISGLTKAANDYTDVVTVSGAGNF